MRIHDYQDFCRRGYYGFMDHYRGKRPEKNRARHCGVAQVAWAAGAVVVLLLSVLVGDLGLLGNKIVFAHLLVIALITYVIRKRLPESDAWKNSEERPAAVKKHLILTCFSRNFSRTFCF